jgi:cell wall-associated NlpC family hydrolase
MRMDMPAVRFPTQLAAVTFCLASCAMSPHTLSTSRTAQTSRTAPHTTDASLSETPIPPQGVIGVEEHHLDPEFWVRQQSQADRPILDASAIEAENARLQQLDPSVYTIEQLPATLNADQVKAWITKLSHRPAAPLFDENGGEVGTDRLDALADSLNLGSIPSSPQSHYGLIVKRADLRTFPTHQRVFTSRVGHDIDRFQESALFPGAPVVIVHESRDRHWWFIVSPLYAAWIDKDYVAQGSAQQVFGYTHKTPYLVITGSTEHTVFTPEQPQVSALQLDMGVRVPVLTDWPANRPVNGEHPYTAHVIELPIRASDGSLTFSPALLQKTVDTAPDYLALTRANLLRQSFKFLGERYGWGHSYDARDCSGFVSEIYRSFGVQLPRNAHDQGVSPALNRVSFTSSDSHKARLAAVRDLQVGDLIYIPGHVMMVIGYDQGVPYVIHDTVGISYRGTAGQIEDVLLNGVSVTPLTQLLLGGQPLIDRIYSIQRIRPVRQP